MPKIEALRRRIVPAVPLTLEMAEDGGGKITRTLRLSFDFVTFALIQERTGIDMTGLRAWSKLNPVTLSVMFWAAVVGCHPEYASDEGLGVIRSYMDVSNEDLIGSKLFEAYTEVLPVKQRDLLRDLKARLERGEAIENPTPPPAIPEVPAEIARNL